MVISIDRKGFDVSVIIKTSSVKARTKRNEGRITPLGTIRKKCHQSQTVHRLMLGYPLRFLKRSTDVLRSIPTWNWGKIFRDPIQIAGLVILQTYNMLAGIMGLDEGIVKDSSPRSASPSPGRSSDGRGPEMGHCSDSPKQVLQIASFAGTVIGGAEISIHLLHKILAQRIPVRLLTTRKGTEYEYLGGGTRVIPPRAYVAGSRILDWYLAVCIIAKAGVAHRPAVIHALDTYVAPATIIAARILGIPCVVTTHNRPWLPSSHLHPIIRGWARFHLKNRDRYLHRFLKSSNGMVFISEVIRREWLEVGVNPPHSKVIFELVPEWEIVPPRQEDETLKLLAAGRLEQYKGFHVVIRAIAMLKEGIPVDLTIAGEGNYRPDLEKLAEELGVCERVRFSGWVSRSELHGLFAESDVVVASTLTVEPLGMVPIEAMSVGRPVIASREGGFMETVVDGVTGILFETGNPQSLSQAIDRLRSDRELRLRMGEAGSRRKREHFSGRASASALLDLYNDVLGMDTFRA